MAYYFSPSQILTLAAENEVAGQSFYTSLAAVVPSEDTKKIFTYLAQQEFEHEKVFRSMADEIGKVDQEQEYAIDIVAEMKKGILEMQELAFKPPMDILDTSLLQKAIQIGIHTEVSSIAAYTQMSHVFTDNFKPIIGAILAEEEAHLKRLTALLSTIKTDPS